MKVGDLVKNKYYPDAGAGIVIKLNGKVSPSIPKRLGLDTGAVALFSHGIEIIYRDEAEVINDTC